MSNLCYFSSILTRYSRLIDNAIMVCFSICEKYPIALNQNHAKGI